MAAKLSHVITEQKPWDASHQSWAGKVGVALVVLPIGGYQEKIDCTHSHLSQKITRGFMSTSLYSTWCLIWGICLIWGQVYGVSFKIISCVMWQVAAKGSSMLRTKFWRDSVFLEFAHGKCVVYIGFIVLQLYSYCLVAYFRASTSWWDIDHTPCAVFWKGPLLQCPPLFSCCLILVDTVAIICHWWCVESKWVK
jgi:hypothetical protein